MASRMIDELSKLGVDTEHTLERLAGNEAIYERFLIKFLQDTNFVQLEQCLSKKDYENALQYAHTLKGVSGNLGMTELYGHMEEMVSIFRGQQEGDVQKLFELSQLIYRAICIAISNSMNN